MKKEQPFFCLETELPLVKYEKTAVCFSDDVSKVAYAYKVSDDQHYLHVMHIDQHDSKCLSGNDMSLSPGVVIQSLCFNTRADQIGMVTTEGKATIVKCGDDYACQMPPCVDEENTFVALAYAQGSAFKKGNFFATTKDGKLFRIKPRHPNKKTYNLPSSSATAGLDISCISWDKTGSMITCAGTLQRTTALGYIHLVFTQEDSALEPDPACTYTAPFSIAFSCFDRTSRLLAFASGKTVYVCKTKNVRPSQGFRFDSDVTRLCFGEQNELFVGLKDGSLHRCRLEREFVTAFSILLQWEHPIKALSYNNETKLLGAATLYKAAFISFLSK